MPPLLFALLSNMRLDLATDLEMDLDFDLDFDVETSTALSHSEAAAVDTDDALKLRAVCSLSLFAAS
jgi:hypothetical protein